VSLPVLDRAYQQEIQDTFAGGMRDRDHPALLRDDQYYFLKNGEIRDAGLCKTRRGAYQRVTGPTLAATETPQGCTFFEPTEGNGFVVALIGGKFYEWGNSGNAWNQIGSNQIGNTTKPVQWSTGYRSSGRVLICHVGMDHKPLYWSGDTGDSFTEFAIGDTDAPYSNVACVQSDRVLCSGNDDLPDHVFYSDIRAVETTKWDKTSQNIKLVTPANERVKAVVSYLDNTILGFTANSTQLISNLNTSDESTIARATIDNKFGTISPRSVAVFGRDAFFLSPDRHVRSIQRSMAAQESRVESFPISFFNPGLMDRINRRNMRKAAAIYYDNYYLLAVPMDSETENSSVLPFDMLHQMEMPFGVAPVMVGEWTGWNVQDWVVATFAGRQRLFYLDNSDGSLWEALIGDTDGVNYPAFELQTRGYQFGSKTANKTLDYSELKYESSFGQLVIQTARDDRTFSTVRTISIGSNAPGLPVDVPFDFGQPADESEYFYGYNLGDSRTWRFKLTHSEGPVNLRELIFSSFVQPTSIRG